MGSFWNIAQDFLPCQPSSNPFSNSKGSDDDATLKTVIKKGLKATFLYLRGRTKEAEIIMTEAKEEFYRVFSLEDLLVAIGKEIPVLGFIIGWCHIFWFCRPLA